MRIDKPEVKSDITMAGSASGLVTIQPAAAAGTNTFTLPTSTGSDKQVLKTDGSGVLGWQAALIPVGTQTITVSTTQPSSPATGDLWVDTT